jgi:hypothetical protein
MIHGPCTNININAACLNKGKCTKGFPRPYVNDSVALAERYPKYRRRNDGAAICRYNKDGILMYSLIGSNSFNVLT